MRFKKGFTLAEILIVLMVIGALATMTIPSLMKGVQEAQFKTAYKKAVNSVVNLTTMEKLSGNLPSVTGDDAGDTLFDILNSNLSAKAYMAPGDHAIGRGTTGDGSKLTNTAPTAAKRYQYWIVTEDNLAYTIRPTKLTANTACKTKLEILNTQGAATSGKVATAGTDDQLADTACFVVYVDVNGLIAGPNLTMNNYVAKTTKLKPITTDVFPIYVGIDGATPGNQKTTVTGRIAADLK